MKKFTLILCLAFISIFGFTKSEDNKQIVILVSLDGFRWDYLDRGKSPKLSEIASDGVRASSLQPQFPTMTFPNHYSIITGLVPENHGIIANYFNNLYDTTFFSLKQPYVTNSIWYMGEAFWETARRNGIITASYFWPGSEIELDYRRPNYYHIYDHNRPYEERVNGVLDWLSLPDSLMPRFVTLYFDETDSKAHRHGTDSPMLNDGIVRVDKIVAMLDSGITSLGLKERVNLIILSDHGMADMAEDRIIAIDEILHDKTDISITALSTLAFINPPKDKINSVYQKLKKSEKGYKVYLKKDIPKRLRYSKHPFISEIMMFAEHGWLIGDTRKWSDKYIATHGYDNKHPEMHGIFIARGPAFKNNYKSGTLNNIDIYPLLCKLFDIYPAGNIDGDILNIIHLLNE
ncbi:MAG: alkaline phosphatase family protein [Candidatus Kapabacteria bacterium]|nr:alkaline phosphatase family protein [Ignavibacteriota bacterium]MCW5883380.1 alkaline phosphatase family protein [Candidatus Kapabacteria bacterium]